jgi:hypothetical protein
LLILPLLLKFRVWIRHRTTKTIELIGRTLQSVFRSRELMDHDTMDACMHRAKQGDGVVVGMQNKVRWWHFMESDFVVSNN